VPQSGLAESNGGHLYIHSFPTRRSSDLRTFSSASVITSVFPARTRKVNANNSAALTGRSTTLIMFSVNSAPSMMRQAVKAAELRSEERFSRNAETDLVCRLLLEKKKYRI